MVAKRLRVAVLFGGQSVEHDVSVVSARAIMNALDPEKYEAVPVAITREGRWLPPPVAKGLLEQSPDRKGGPGPADHSASGIAPIDVPALAVSQTEGVDFGRFDVVFPVVHGTQGEDGTVQGLLELAGLPYVGGGVLASAVGMDKATMKSVFRDAGLPVACFLVIRKHDWQAGVHQITARVGPEVGYPCFVKPSNGGSSVGVAKVPNEGGFRVAVDKALQLDRKVIVEEAIPGRELECSVLGNDDPIASTVGEIVPKREFYDYEAKYHDDRTELLIPAPIPHDVAKSLRGLALEAFRALDCSGMARVDFFLRTVDNKLFVNEINTIPGFTQVSMYPKLWEASGIGYRDLVDRLVQLALERHRESQQTRERYAEIRPGA